MVKRVRKSRTRVRFVRTRVRLIELTQCALSSQHALEKPKKNTRQNLVTFWSLGSLSPSLSVSLRLCGLLCGQQMLLSSLCLFVFCASFVSLYLLLPSLLFSKHSMLHGSIMSPLVDTTSVALLAEECFLLNAPLLDLSHPDKTPTQVQNVTCLYLKPSCSAQSAGQGTGQHPGEISIPVTVCCQHTVHSIGACSALLVRLLWASYHPGRGLLRGARIFLWFCLVCSAAWQGLFHAPDPLASGLMLCCSSACTQNRERTTSQNSTTQQANQQQQAQHKPAESNSNNRHNNMDSTAAAARATKSTHTHTNTQDTALGRECMKIADHDFDGSNSISKVRTRVRKIELKFDSFELRLHGLIQSQCWSLFQFTYCSPAGQTSGKKKHEAGK
jgi:hypothetical protein